MQTTKILMMKMMKLLMKNKRNVFIAMWLGIGIIGTFVCAFFGLNSLCSFGFGFVAFSVVCGSSFIGILRQIKAQQSPNNDFMQDCANEQSSDTKQEQNKQNIPFSSRFIVGTRLSLSLLRMLSYIALIAGVLVLIEAHLMQPQSLLFGIGSALVATLLGAVIMIKG